MLRQRIAVSPEILPTRAHVDTSVTERARHRLQSCFMALPVAQ